MDLISLHLIFFHTTLHALICYLYEHMQGKFSLLSFFFSCLCHSDMRGNLTGTETIVFCLVLILILLFILKYSRTSVAQTLMTRSPPLFRTRF